MSPLTYTPIQALLENALAQPVHLGEIVDEFPVVLRRGELHRFYEAS